MKMHTCVCVRVCVLYVHLFVCECVCVLCVCMCICVLCVCMFICLCVCVYVFCAYICVCVFVCVRVRVCVCVPRIWAVYTHTYQAYEAHIHIHLHIHSGVHERAFLCTESLGKRRRAVYQLLKYSKGACVHLRKCECKRVNVRECTVHECKRAYSSSPLHTYSRFLYCTERMCVVVHKCECE